MRSVTATAPSPRLKKFRWQRGSFSVGVLTAVPLILSTVLVVAPSAQFPAHAADACAPGTAARIAGPPPALTQMGLLPDVPRPTGAGVVVAIVDSGIDASRAQLAGAFAPGSTSLVPDDQPATGLSDIHGHGTAIAGIIAARPSPDSGVVGVAPDSQLVSIRVFRGDDENLRKQGLGPDSARTAAGIRAGTDAGAQIIVVAISDDSDNPALQDATEYAAAHGALVVASAGNTATTENVAQSPRYPAAYPQALGVTAVSLAGIPTEDSVHGTHIDVAAPGQEVLTTATGAGDCIYAQDAPAASFATAYAAGAAALLAEAFPQEGPEGWAYRLKATADRPNPDSSDEMIGWGRVQPIEALGLRLDLRTRGPESPFVNNTGSSIAPPVTRIVAAPPGHSNVPLVASVTVIVLGLLATLGILGRLRKGG